MQTLADIEIREQRDQDYDPLAGIRMAIYPDSPVTADELREQANEINPTRYAHVRLVAMERAGGQIVAGAAYHQVPWSYHPDKYRVALMVHPRWQARGIGRRLMEQMLGDLRARGARRVKASAREDLDQSTAFLHRFGFAEHGRGFESRLQVDACDLRAFAGYAERVAHLGIALTTLAEELRRSPDCLRAIYEMHCVLDIGVPRDDPEIPTPPLFDEFLAHSVHSPRALPDAYFLAKLGDVYVGESVLKASDADPRLLHQELTGVLPDLRGLGIATAVKLKTVEYAQRGGHREIRTMNSSKNGPMLAINGKLGFVRQPAWIEFQKVI